MNMFRCAVNEKRLNNYIYKRIYFIDDIKNYKLRQ